MIGTVNWATLRESLSLKQRFNRDVVWNMGSVAVLGVSGILWNLAIGKYVGAAALGIFSYVYAVYVFLSQIAVGGVHASVLKEVSYHQSDPARCREVTAAALMITVVLSGSICLIVFAARDVLKVLLPSPEIAIALTYAVPGLIFFSINKVLLNVLNGARHMRAFAVFSALRYLCILATIIILIAFHSEPVRLPVSFLAAEIVLFLGLLLYLESRSLGIRLTQSCRPWIRPHLSFGARGVFSGMLSDLNTNIDILMLGQLLHSNAMMGVYAIAARVAEGFMQLPAILQRNVNPIIGRYFAEKDHARIEEAARKVRRILHPAMALIGLAAIAAFPLLVRIMSTEDSFDGSWSVFCILMIGIVINAGYAPMRDVFFQGGRPGIQTFLMGCTILSNIVLNFALIPLLGLKGAAIATAIAYILQAILLLGLAKRLFGLTLWK